MKKSVQEVISKSRPTFDAVINSMATRYDMTDREVEILNLLVRQYSNPEIAERANITRNTVKFHLKNIYGKLGADTRQEVIRKVLELL